MERENNGRLQYDVDHWREFSPRDPLVVAGNVGAAAIQAAAETPHITADNFLRLARAEIDRPLSMFFHPVPTAQQELLMFQALGEPNGVQPKPDIPVRQLLKNQMFISTVSTLKHTEDRQHWLYVLAMSRTVKELITSCNYRLVVITANKVGGGLLSPSDRWASGAIGLQRAIETYNPKKLNPETGQPYRFSGYAVHSIRNSVQQQICTEYGISRNAYQYMAGMTYFSVGLGEVLGRRPTAEELETQLLALADGQEGRPKIGLRTIAQLVKLHGKRTESSLDRKLTDDSTTTLGDMTASTSNVAEEAASHMLAAAVADALHALHPVGQQLIRHVFGLSGLPPISLESAGRQLGLDAEKARQQLAAAMAVLSSNQTMRALAEGEGLINQAGTDETARGTTTLPSQEADRTVIERHPSDQSSSTEELVERYQQATDVKERARWLAELALRDFSLEELAQLRHQSTHNLSQGIRYMKKQGWLHTRPQTASQLQRHAVLETVKSLTERGLRTKEIAGQLKMTVGQVQAARLTLRLRGELPKNTAQHRQAASDRQPATTKQLKEWTKNHPFEQWRYDKLRGAKEGLGARQQHQSIILAHLQANWPTGVSISEMNKLPELAGLSRLTLWRYIGRLLDSGQATTSGRAMSTRYHAVPSAEQAESG